MTTVSIKKIHHQFSKAYGSLTDGMIPKGRPLDILIQTILSQNTSDVNSVRAYKSLRKAFPSWEKATTASQEDVADCIREGGLAEMKSARILKVLELVHEREGRASLTSLKKLSDQEALAYLTSLPGVGTKTAACVLLFSLDRHVMPVDTHVFRIASRLGLINGDIKIDDAGSHLETFIPGELTRDMHLYMIEHGRQTCKARNPRCDTCTITGFCPHFSNNGGNGNGHAKK